MENSKDKNAEAENHICADKYRSLVKELFEGHLEQCLALRSTGYPYSKRLTHSSTTQYSPANAAALDEMCFAVSQASREDNMDLNCPLDFEKSIPIVGRDPLTWQESLMAYIFVSCKLNIVVLAFKVTETIGELINNFDFFQEPPIELVGYQLGMLVERGFYRLYQTTQAAIHLQLTPLLKHGVQLVVTGHSLGGTLATFASYEFASHCPIVYTFASPRVGNPKFSQEYNKAIQPAWRIDNSSDIVPDLPFPDFLNQKYEHVGNPVVFTLNLGDILSNHTGAYSRVIIDRKKPENPNGICPSAIDCSSSKYG